MNLKTLYSVVLQELKKNRKPEGICVIADKVLFGEEFMAFRKDMFSRKPRFFNLAWWHYSYCRTPFSAYWWSVDETGKKQRIKFLENIIRKL